MMTVVRLPSSIEAIVSRPMCCTFTFGSFGVGAAVVSVGFVSVGFVSAGFVSAVASAGFAVAAGAPGAVVLVGGFDVGEAASPFPAVPGAGADPPEVGCLSE